MLPYSQYRAEIEAFSLNEEKDTQKKSKKVGLRKPGDGQKQARGAPKSQQKQNEMLFVEMQRYRVWNPDDG